MSRNGDIWITDGFIKGVLVGAVVYRRSRHKGGYTTIMLAEMTGKLATDIHEGRYRNVHICMDSRVTLVGLQSTTIASNLTPKCYNKLIERRLSCSGLLKEREGDEEGNEQGNLYEGKMAANKNRPLSEMNSSIRGLQVFFISAGETQKS